MRALFRCGWLKTRSRSRARPSWSPSSTCTLVIMSDAAAVSLDAWWQLGQREQVRASDGSTQELFVIDAGQGPPLTLLHGYPGSSHDFAGLFKALCTDHRVLAPDLLGFGASSKPAPHEYSIAEQADLVAQLWERRGITSTVLVAHDYSASLAQELLASPRGMTFTCCALLNGGVYPDLHRPTLGQQLLLSEEGPAVAQSMTEQLFCDGVAQTFGSRHPATPAELQDLWRAMTLEAPSTQMATMLHYVADRRANASRWTAALERTSIPTIFVWGPEDPVSGAHMLERIKERCSKGTIVELDGVGHWPSIEAPGEVASSLRSFLEHHRA